MEYLYLIPGILLAISLHEFAHGWVSWKLGDPTPKQEGRLTINPLRHLDPFGALCMLLFHMGWAKPVMINPYYYKNQKTGTALVSLAGPGMNLITGAISVFILAGMYAGVQSGRLPYTTAMETVYTILYYFSVLSINLAVFNLIPIPPLDGSKILGVFLPDSVNEWFNRNDRYCMIILMIALYVGVLDAPITFFYDVIHNGIWKLALSIFWPQVSAI